MRKLYAFMLLVATSLALSCEREKLPEANDGMEIVIATSISNGADTKAIATVADYVGRGVVVDNSADKDFEEGDKMLLTKISRTDSPLTQFTYKNESFENSGGSWSRTSDTERIYWSDAENPHTFIGYSTPKEWKENDWTLASDGMTYYGSIGDPTSPDEVIDFTSNDLIKKEDILLTYNVGQVAEPGGSVAKLIFRHGLANIRVIVNIKGFAPTSNSADTESLVKDLVLKNMPVMYKWTQISAETEPLEDSDNAVVGYDQKKDFMTWLPKPEGAGTGAERTFTFYALAVPGETNLEIPFTVSYPKALDPTRKQEKKYTATLENVLLKAGYCTTINLSLNHAEEEITVGASYLDWEFKETPDEGSLRKNSVYLEKTERSFVTIVGDDLATEDDAVWLYGEYEMELDQETGKMVYKMIDGKRVPVKDNAGRQIIKDIYGHEGNSAVDAYQISSAQQFLSFAYEVNTAANEAKGRPVMDFSEKYIRLDAGISLQEKRTTDGLAWIGIDGGSNPFNGTFLGCGRSISRLKGNPLFIATGAAARIENLILQDVINIGSATGAFVQTNAGTLAACTINGNVSTTSTFDSGSLVGTNAGTVYACSQVGAFISASSVLGGLVGNNSGSVISSFHAGAISSTGTYTAYGTAAVNTGTIKYCFYNTRSASNVNLIAPEGTTVENSRGENTANMQKAAFVTSLNDGLTSHSYSDFHFVHKVTSYPVVESGPVPASGSDPDSGSQP